MSRKNPQFVIKGYRWPLQVFHHLVFDQEWCIKTVVRIELIPHLQRTAPIRPSEGSGNIVLHGVSVDAVSDNAAPMDGGYSRALAHLAQEILKAVKEGKLICRDDEVKEMFLK